MNLRALTDADLEFDPVHPAIKPDRKPLMKMVVPGRRALGEDYSEVTVYEDGDALGVHTQPTEAPAQRVPILVPGTHEMEQYRDILEAQKGKQAEGKMLRGDGQCEVSGCRHADETCARWRLLNEMWMNYMEQKVRIFKGISTVGNRLYQRERFRRD